MTLMSAGVSSQDNDIYGSPSSDDTPPCVLCFNAVDPTGAGGLTSDALTIAALGGHALPVATGVYWRDTRETLGYSALDDTAVMEQARMVAEDVPLQAIKVGFACSAEALAVIAAFASDYPSVPLLAYMPDLSWWDAREIDAYLDAFRELLLPQTAVLIGNNSTLRHWLLPESATSGHARTVDLARVAAELGVSHVLATGLALPGGEIGNVLASPQAVLCTQGFERIDASFRGAGDTLSAALAALLALGSDLVEASTAALHYLDQALDHGFQPGMGHALADRLFCAGADELAAGETHAPSNPHMPRVLP